MDVLTYLNKMKKIENNLLDVINDEEGKFNDNYFKKKENFLSNPNDENDFKSFITLIGNISTHHHRSPTFISNIKKILLLFKDDIVNKLTKEEIYENFIYNRLILLFLIQNDIFKIDSSNIKLIKKHINDIIFFLPEVVNQFNQTYNSKSLPDNYFENREKGENESQICELIRKDSIDDFIIYVNKNNISLNSTIKPSDYETNQLLLSKNPTLIEYAAFFGSIQIFKYLHLNKAIINHSIWKYSIHSNNAELICFLIDNEIQPKDQTYKECFMESIKCFHNNIAHYIKENLLKEKVDNNDDEYEEEDDDDDDYKTFRYHNFEFYPEGENLSIWSIIFLIKKNELELANFYLESKNISKDFLFKMDNYTKIRKNIVQNKVTGQIFEINEAICELNQTFIYLLDEAIKFKDFPSILEIKGFKFTENDEMPAFLYDHFSNGTLYDYAIKNELTNTQKYILILGISITMKFLHDNKIILNHLYPGNILIDDNFYPLVNITSFSYNKEYMLNYIPPYFIYSSPEYFFRKEIHFSCNVFTYSLLVYLIVTGKHPFKINHRYDVFKIKNKILIGYRPDTRGIDNDLIKSLLDRCWDYVPMNRPSFDDIVNLITKEKFYSCLEPFDHQSVIKYLDTFAQYECFKKLKDNF